MRSWQWGAERIVGTGQHLPVSRSGTHAASQGAIQAMNCRLFCFHTLLVLLISGAAFAQDTGSITGTVTDPSGAIVANAQVVVSSPERGVNRTTSSNSDGEYSVPAIPS